MSTKHSLTLAMAGIVLLTLGVSLRASEGSDSVESPSKTSPTSTLRFSFSTSLKNTGVQPKSTGKLRGQFTRIGALDSQRISILLGSLQPNTACQLATFTGVDTIATNPTLFTPDVKGKFSALYFIRNGKPLPDALNPLNNVRELEITTSGRAILHTDITHSDRFRYQYRGLMLNSGVIPGAAATLRINGTEKSTQFGLQASGLPINTEFILAVNVSSTQIVTSDRNGRLNLRALPSGSPSALSIHAVSLSTSSSGVVIFTLKGLGIPPDNTAPAVIATTPIDASTNVPTNANISATFNKAVILTSITPANFTVSGPGATPVSGTISFSTTSNVVFFTPTALLATNTLFTATLAAGIQDYSGNVSANSVTWSFTTSLVTDSTPPFVTSTSPSNLAIGIAFNRSVTATFSEAMLASTINSDTFTLQQGGTTVASSVSYLGTTATLMPTTALSANTLYSATITAGVKDLVGNAKTTPYNWSFTTGLVSDTTAPFVVTPHPLNLATSVPLNNLISATFSEEMLSSSINTTSFTLLRGITPVSGSVLLIDTVAIFTPTSILSSNTTYTVSITSSVTDLAGNAMQSPYTWSFTTGLTSDTTPPFVNSTLPANLATGVATNSLITVMFNEAMLGSTINAASFTLQQGTTMIVGSVSYSGTTAIFTPSAQLASNTIYNAAITTAVTDLAGNAKTTPYNWSFTTSSGSDTTPPTITSTSPLDVAINVPINTLVKATFFEAMLNTTITSSSFLLKQGLTPIDGSVSYLNNVATFNSTVDLAPSTLYNATVTTVVTDLAGNAMASTYVWSFTTGTMSSGSPKPIALGSANTFATLAGSTVTSVGPTQLNGDLGVSPGTAVTGFPPGNVTGSSHAGDGTAATAKNDLLAAYNDGAARLGAATLPGNLGGLTFTPGLYKNSSSTMISGTGANAILTLDAQGDANAVFIFQMGSTLTTDSGTQVVLSGGAKAGNIYWQVGSSATIGTSCIFKGNILADQSITLTTGATLEGRALTRIGAVSLDSNTVTVPVP